MSTSGTGFELAAGGYRASIASIGASLRSLEYHGRPLIVPFDDEEVRPAFRGATLAPWPNRVVDGRYSFGGVQHQLALTEPGRGHALHGLAAWLDFRAIEQSADSATLAATIPAQDGYPHTIDVRVAFALEEGGLRTTVTGTNTGMTAAPWGTAPHPYLVAGEGRVDDWELLLPADRVLTVTEDRLIPVALAEVAETGWDFRRPRIIADTFIDHAFTGLKRATDGIAAVHLRTSSGSGVEMTWDTACPWVQIHTADRDAPELSRLGLAVEPMTCPPDAFNSGTDLVTLSPGASSTASWTIAALVEP